VRVRKLSPEVRARVRADAVARVQAGERTIDVATSIGVSDTSLWRWCREASVTVRRRITP
jgi:transposase-like protein